MHLCYFMCNAIFYINKIVAKKKYKKKCKLCVCSKVLFIGLLIETNISLFKIHINKNNIVWALYVTFYFK